MLTLKGDLCYLRALEPDDLTHVHRIENDENLWYVGDTITPYSLHTIKEYLDNAHRDIYEVKQLRLAICERASNDFLGLIDIFDFDPLNLRAGVGIVIEKEMDRGKGYASAALELLISYCRKHLQLHQLYANIGEDNKDSIRLFEKIGFIKAGHKRDWRRDGGTFKDELLFQLIL